MSATVALNYNEQASVSRSIADSNFTRDLDRSGIDLNAAPLEQNVKNLMCNGVPFRVVKEQLPAGFRTQNQF
jgi:hypothetical protein